MIKSETKPNYKVPVVGVIPYIVPSKLRFARQRHNEVMRQSRSSFLQHPKFGVRY